MDTFNLPTWYLCQLLYFDCKQQKLTLAKSAPKKEHTGRALGIGSKSQDRPEQAGSEGQLPGSSQELHSGNCNM